jgi:glucose-1-phosphate thymidylyltransferase
VNLAIIDVAADRHGQPHGLSGVSRYLTPIANLPLICHVFDELAGSGIDRARIIASAGLRTELDRVLGGGRSWGVEVSYAEAPDLDGRTVVLAEIRQALSEGPVLLHPGDCLFPGQVAVMRERFDGGDVDLVLLAQEPGAPPRIGRKESSALPPIAPRGSQGPGRICDTAVILGPATRDVLGELLSPSLDGRDLIEYLVGSDCRLGVCELAEHWCYSDSTEALLAGNRMLLDALPVPAVHGSFGDRNQVHGRVAVSPEAQVSGSTVHGPVVIDDGAIVEDSFIGPYTAIGRDATVSGTEIDNTMVLAGAEVRYPGYRIEASIIGERASVSRSFDMPKGLHMRLGPDSRVTLS